MLIRFIKIKKKACKKLAFIIISLDLFFLTFLSTQIKGLYVSITNKDH